MNNKKTIFEQELSYIANEDIRQCAEKAVSLLPDYFFKVAASSTGKYHPKYALGDGGLVRHTKAAARFANHLLQLEQNKKAFSDQDRDLIIVSILLHDGWKHGKDGSSYTTHDHPIVCAEWVKSCEDLKGIISDEDRMKVSNAISSHMGEWNTNKRSSVVLPKPETDMQKFVHMCDYLASRKDIEILFDEPANNNASAPAPVTAETYIFGFGKYRGESLASVYANHPDYVEWLERQSVGSAQLQGLIKGLAKNK